MKLAKREPKDGAGNPVFSQRRFHSRQASLGICGIVATFGDDALPAILGIVVQCGQVAEHTRSLAARDKPVQAIALRTPGSGVH